MDNLDKYGLLRNQHKDGGDAEDEDDGLSGKKGTDTVITSR